MPHNGRPVWWDAVCYRCGKAATLPEGQTCTHDCHAARASTEPLPPLIRCTRQIVEPYEGDRDNAL